VALGWGLWEGPARFIFLATFFARKLDSRGINARLSVALTFERSGIIYGTEDEG
jgi:hypothetical protein